VAWPQPKCFSTTNCTNDTNAIGLPFFVHSCDSCYSLFLCPFLPRTYATFVENACQENKMLRLCSATRMGPQQNACKKQDVRIVRHQFGAATKMY
jgi:hypothetical protein